jgi:hypothetical protein
MRLQYIFLYTGMNCSDEAPVKYWFSIASNVCHHRAQGAGFAERRRTAAAHRFNRFHAHGLGVAITSALEDVSSLCLNLNR